ncbi:hypothetical protein VOLCADRAFT_89573 [Volvox carteri f. nagariensis]|uniref:OCRE domain-containing protein n=1 Tax=Volvox carteri f. nagariensis TaxID=3068 RepID=D8TS71_VOLCA|nr:uncharacterized protein VOLCADRAFT_89573 [Volvox carteri f. nagariensis]EFJ49774.1 hypothetical protein VOLCADRAFT_89573 [Volvox carteri f. nagariensis]|eukprot:XP_002949281.1 hypothetical protein VOLCADRAFT_89573 [Volvox carteri f. nagariensis]
MPPFQLAPLSPIPLLPKPLASHANLDALVVGFPNLFCSLSILLSSPLFRIPVDGAARARRAATDKEMPSEPEGPIRSLDPALAATRRARFRAEASRMQLLEDTSMPDDLAAAEEDYDEPEELYNEEGIPMEPFHLRAEREAGYFDAEGNYLEYRLEAEDTDAWLESIMSWARGVSWKVRFCMQDEHRQVRADPELAARRRKAAAAAGLGSGGIAGGPASGGAPAGKKGRRQRGGGTAAAATGSAQADAEDDAKVEDEDDDDDDDDGPYDMHMLDDIGAVLDEDERAVYQKRVADLLQPGETPLDGLRRLGKMMHEEPAAAAAAAASGGAAAGKPRSRPATSTDGGGAGGTGGAGGVDVDGSKGEAAGRGGGAGGGVDGAEVAAGDDVQMKTATGHVAVGAPGGAEGGGGGGGTAGSMAHLSCGERQRLRKQRREQQQVAGGSPTAATMPAVPPPPPPPMQQDRPDNEAEAAGQAVPADPSRGSPEEVGGQEGVEAAGRQQGGSRTSGGDVEMEEAGTGRKEELGEGEAAAAAAAAVAAEPCPGDAPPSPLARQSVAEATAAAAARRRAPAGELSEAAKEARRQFDALTSYANLLLSAGMYDVYNSTREQLLRAAQRVLGVDVVRSLTVDGHRPVGQAATAVKANPKRPAPAGGPEGRGATAGGSGGGEGTVDQPDDGDGDQILAAGGGGSGASVNAAQDGDVDMFEDGDEDDDEGRGGSSGGSRGGSGGGGPLQLQLGYYHDTATGLYGDANTGLWYRYVAREGTGGDEGGDGAVPSGRFELATASEQQRQQQQEQGGLGQRQEVAGAAATG